MRIVLSGYYGYGNVGDEAILLSIMEVMRKQEPDIQFTVLSYNPEETMETFGVQAINRFDFKKIYQTIKASDGLISGGGSLIQDETGLRSVPYYTSIIRIAKWLKKPVFIYAQGIGPIKQYHNKLLVRWTFNKADVITVRDKISKQFLVDIGVKKDVHVVPDPVLGLDYTAYQSQWLEQLGLEKKAYIAVSVRDWYTKVPFKEKIAESLDRLIERGNSIVFIPMHGDTDEAISQEIASMMKHKPYIAPYHLSTGEKIAVIGQARLLIGIRLHSLIFAALNHTPFLALSYDPKIDAFASIFKQPVVGHVSKDDWDSESLLAQALLQLDDYQNQCDFIKEKAEHFYKEAVKTSEIACELFRGTK